MKVGQRGRILSQYGLKIEIESIFCYCKLTLIEDNAFILAHLSDTSALVVEQAYSLHEQFNLLTPVVKLYDFKKRF
jgi:hypothetical protein